MELDLAKKMGEQRVVSYFVCRFDDIPYLLRTKTGRIFGHVEVGMTRMTRERVTNRMDDKEMREMMDVNLIKLGSLMPSPSYSTSFMPSLWAQHETIDIPTYRD